MGSTLNPLDLRVNTVMCTYFLLFQYEFEMGEESLDMLSMCHMDVSFIQGQGSWLTIRRERKETQS